MMLPATLTRDALHLAYRQGVQPADVVTACHARLAAVGDPGIFLHLVPVEAAVAAAHALPPFDPERFPLWGLPFAIKDNIDLAGAPTTAACPQFAYTPHTNATVVQRLVEAGAMPLGKTNLDQFATGLVGVRTPHPAPRNPFDAARVPGGSSSGSAVAVAQGVVSFALGTDTAGSGRIPAAFCNLVGLKPSLGALSCHGVVPACRTLDCVSIFAATVADARAVFACAAAYDARDPYSRGIAPDETPIRRIAVPREADLMFFGDTVMAGAWDAALERLSALGHTPTPIGIAPFLAAARLLYEGPWVAERRAAVGAFMEENPDALHPVTRAILASADAHSATDAFRAFYSLAALKREAMEALAGFDALVVPTAPIFPTLAEMANDPIGPNSRLGTYTNGVNLLDLAAMAVPGPFRADGLPAGITFIGRSGSDLALAEIAGRFFPGTGGRSRRETRNAA
jgi:allophanate hydrolase